MKSCGEGTSAEGQSVAASLAGWLHIIRIHWITRVKLRKDQLCRLSFGALALCILLKTLELFHCCQSRKGFRWLCVVGSLHLHSAASVWFPSRFVCLPVQVHPFACARFLGFSSRGVCISVQDAVFGASTMCVAKKEERNQPTHRPSQTRVHHRPHADARSILRGSARGRAAGSAFASAHASVCATV